MALGFHPDPGVIVVCNYQTGFVVPEMVKTRPVVVVSPRFRNRPGLCTVVPLSSVEPTPIERYHHRISEGAYPPARGPMWAKCDMLATVSLARLDRIRTKDPAGKRLYVVYQMPEEDMELIRHGICHALGLLDG